MDTDLLPTAAAVTELRQR